MMISVRFALWSAAAGALIPVMAVLNARLGRSLGEPLHAPVILFGVGLLACVVVSLALTGALPTPANLALAPVQPADLAGGLIVAFYVVSATLVAPRFGVGNLILFAMVAQIVFSAAIDHYGLLGVPVRPVGVMRMGGLLLMTTGLVITQFADSK